MSIFVVLKNGRYIYPVSSFIKQ